jgi:hypothetical protein
MESYSQHIRLKGMSSELGLCSDIATDRDDMGCARRAKVFLHTPGNSRIVAEQDAGEK